MDFFKNDLRLKTHHGTHRIAKRHDFWVVGVGLGFYVKKPSSGGNREIDEMSVR